MDITPFLKYYLGCKAQVKRKTVMDEYLTGTIVEITKGSNHGDWVDVDFGTVVEIYTRTWEKSMSNFHSFFLREDEIKPILRRIGSLTTEERNIYQDIYKNKVLAWFEVYQRYAEATHYLISKGIWAFSDKAFEDNSIIDADTLDKPLANA